MKLFLIRHGESMQNTKENQILRLPDHKVYLTENGKNEAYEAGCFLNSYILKNSINLNNSILWVSPFARTRETADIINTQTQILDIKEDYRLIEQQYGLFSDGSISVLRAKYQDEFEVYDNYYQNEGKFYMRLPQGESPMDVAIRTNLFLNDLKLCKKENHFIVTHGTTMRTIVMNEFGYSPEWFANEPNMENCSIRLLDTNNNTDEYIYGGPIKKKIK